MKQPTFFKGRPIIQPGEVYEIDGVDFKVITATSKILEDGPLGLKMSHPVFHLENVETKEMVYIPEKELQGKFTEK